MINIFIDGIDGTGKTTLIDNLLDRILTEPIVYEELSLFQFPSRMPEQHEKASDLCRTMFHLQDFYEVMREHRKQEDIRLFDRSFLSTLSYQGFNEGIEVNPRFESIARLGAECLLTSGHVSDTARQQIFISVTADPEVAASRVFKRTTDRVYDIEEIEDFDSVVDRLALLQERFEMCYQHCKMHLPQLFPEHSYRYIVVDSTEKNPDEVFVEVMSKLEDFLAPPQLSLSV